MKRRVAAWQPANTAAQALSEVDSLEVYAPDDHQHHGDGRGQGAVPRDTCDSRHARESGHAHDAQQPHLLRLLLQRHLDVEGEDRDDVADVGGRDQKTQHGLQAPSIRHREPHEVLHREHHGEEHLEREPDVVLLAVHLIALVEHGLQHQREDGYEDQHAHHHGEDAGRHGAVWLLHENLDPRAQRVRLLLLRLEGLQGLGRLVGGRRALGVLPLLVLQLLHGGHTPPGGRLHDVRPRRLRAEALDQAEGLEAARVALLGHGRQRPWWRGRQVAQRPRDEQGHGVHHPGEVHGVLRLLAAVPPVRGPDELLRQLLLLGLLARRRHGAAHRQEVGREHRGLLVLAAAHDLQDALQQVPEGLVALDVARHDGAEAVLVRAAGAAGPAGGDAVELLHVDARPEAVLHEGDEAVGVDAVGALAGLPHLVHLRDLGLVQPCHGRFVRQRQELGLL
mmetsp:Transcript_122927/g.382063  ORF Transcript_122927/g.382063 Transcript_122927/m.382063 type:complete len:450 (-) Transcript_122927:233-1582(-)